MMFGYGMGGFGFLFMLLIVALTIGFIVWLVTAISRGVASSSSQSAGPAPSQTPLEIAQRRFAGGEITRAEYEDIRHTLGTV